MSNVLNRMRLSGLSRASVVIGTVVVILGIVAAFVGYQLYQKLTTNTVVAYFSNALALYPGDVSSVHGLETSCDSQVLDADGKAIPGLYAVGLDQNTVMRGFYPGGGSGIGPAMTFGYRAARHIAAA